MSSRAAVDANLGLAAPEVLAAKTRATKRVLAPGLLAMRNLAGWVLREQCPLKANQPALRVRWPASLVMSLAHASAAGTCLRFAAPARG